MKQAIIDRFEGDDAVIEFDGRTFACPKALLPDNAKEGDVLSFSVGVDSNATENRSDRIQELEDDLFI